MKFKNHVLDNHKFQILHIKFVYKDASHASSHWKKGDEKEKKRKSYKRSSQSNLRYCISLQYNFWQTWEVICFLVLNFQYFIPQSVSCSSPIKCSVSKTMHHPRVGHSSESKNRKLTTDDSMKNSSDVLNTKKTEIILKNMQKFGYTKEST